MTEKKQTISVASNAGSHRNSNTEAAADQVDPDLLLLLLFQSGHGCNLTLFNSNVLKEEEHDEEDLRIGQNLAGGSGFNHSGSSFHDSSAPNAATATGRNTSKQGKSKNNKGGNANASNEGAPPRGKPWWLNLPLFYLMSFFGIGWILRLVIYYRSVSCNIFLRKVVLR